MVKKKFLKLVKSQEIGGKEYFIIPLTAKIPNYIGVWAGKTACFWSNCHRREYKGKKWHFFKIPPVLSVKAYNFPNCRKTKKGWNYGAPKWIFN